MSGQVREFCVCAGSAEVSLASVRVAAFAQNNSHAAPGAVRRLELGRVLELLEVVLIRPVFDIHLEFVLEIGPAPLTRLPVSRVLFVVVIAAEGVATVVSIATVSGV